jgi:conjugative transposon TraN protein
MNWKCVVGLCFMTIIVGQSVIAQSEQLPELWLTTSKTTVIVSHFKIKSVDRGSRDVLVQKVAGVDTLLELKAGRADFPETNLTILTGDGIVHMFLVRFNAAPPSLRYWIAADRSGPLKATVDGEGDPLTEAGFEFLADSILNGPIERCGHAARSCGAKASVTGIFVHGKTLFFRFRLKNKSNIGYDIGQLNFYIRDKDQAKRTAAQVLSQIPIFFKGEDHAVKGRSQAGFITAFQKFTIPDQKILVVVIKERDGGRLLRLVVTNKELLKAKVI